MNILNSHFLSTALPPPQYNRLENTTLSYIKAKQLPLLFELRECNADADEQVIFHLPDRIPKDDIILLCSEWRLTAKVGKAVDFNLFHIKPEKTARVFLYELKKCMKDSTAANKFLNQMEEAYHRAVAECTAFAINIESFSLGIFTENWDPSSFTIFDAKDKKSINLQSGGVHKAMQLQCQIEYKAYFNLMHNRKINIDGKDYSISVFELHSSSTPGQPASLDVFLESTGAAVDLVTKETVSC